MRIVFCGLGSIGKRHIRNLVTVLNKRGIEYSIDVIRHGVKDIEDDNIKGYINSIHSYDEIEQLEYDIAFITNPTSKHYDTIKQMSAHVKHMFIEKPIFETEDVDYDKLNKCLNKNSVYYVACPLRYTLAYQYIKRKITIEDIISARAISSSYLPEWRPNTDYRDTYSAHKELGGGVAIDLIHEWDYLTDLFGFPEDVFYVGGKYSDLEIDSDDLATYIGRYQDKIVELHLDYFGRKSIRELVLYTNDDIIIADYINKRITYSVSGEVINLEEERDDYQVREIEHFMDIIDGKCSNDSSIEHAIKVLKLTKG